MSNLGPTWLRKELPHPVARAWHFALQGTPVDGMAAASAVEVALRLVAALQLASLLAEPEPRWPDMLRERFDRPTLGSWRVLVETLRKEARAPFVEALGTWPDKRTNERLRRLVEDRNRLAHAGQLSPGARRELELSVAEQSAEILMSLEWLRRLELIIVSDARAAQNGTSEGHIQSFRSTETHPELVRAAWRGLPEPGRVYLVGDGRLLDVEPFLQRALLRGAKSEALCLWKGIGQRGDVISSDDTAQVDAFVPLTQRTRILPFVRLALHHGPEDATRPDAPAPFAPEPPTLVPLPGEKSPPRRKRLKRYIIGALGVVGLSFLVMFLTSLASPSAKLRAPQSDVPVKCPAPGLSGSWDFNTYVLRSKPGMEYGLNVSGHYEAKFGSASGTCRISVALTKTGYTQSGKRNNDTLDDMVSFTVSRTGRSLAGSARLKRDPKAKVSADIALRVSRWGDFLVGYWRHEGADWEAGGYSGALLGRKRGQTVPEDLRTSCFFDCVDACARGADPKDELTEPCVVDCGRRLADCR